VGNRRKFIRFPASDLVDAIVSRTLRVALINGLISFASIDYPPFLQIVGDLCKTPLLPNPCVHDRRALRFAPTGSNFSPQNNISITACSACPVKSRKAVYLG